MLAPLIIGFVGFAMTTLGVAMLFLGEVPFIAGRRIPARRSRWVGGVLVSFLPLAFGLNQLIKLVFEPGTVDGLIVTGSMFGVCLLVVSVILFRVLVPKRERKAAPAERANANPFGEPAAAPIEAMELSEEPKPTKKGSAKQAPAKKTPPVEQESDPFDFS